MKTISVQNAIWKEDKHYVAQCLNVDVSSFGNTKKEALTNLQEALELYFEDTHVLPVSVVQKPEIVQTRLARA